MTNFSEGVQKWSDFFGRELKQSQLNYYYDEIKHIQEKEWEFIVKDFIINKKPIPSQFPTIAEIQGMCPKPSGQTFTKKESIDDYYRRVPVNMLFQAFHILKTNGKESFEHFCDVKNINQNDREAVKLKLSVNFPEEFKEIQDFFQDA